MFLGPKDCKTLKDYGQRAFLSSLEGAAASIIFVATKPLVVTTKRVVVTTKHVFCRDKRMLVATKLLSRQNVCHDKIMFVAANTCLSRQNTCLSRQKYACHDKRFSRQK